MTSASRAGEHFGLLLAPCPDHLFRGPYSFRGQADDRAASIGGVAAPFDEPVAVKPPK